MLTTVNPVFYLPAFFGFAILHTSCTAPVICPYERSFPNLRPFFGGPHKTMNFGFYCSDKSWDKAQDPLNTMLGCLQTWQKSEALRLCSTDLGLVQ